jgi:lycopene beta-cyclase
MDKSKSSTTFINNETVYDFLFIGLGAGNSLILLALLKKGLASNKKIAVVEPTKKNTNDKTYCFWASPNDSIVNDLEPIISHYYNSIEVNGSPSQNIEKQPYYFIKSIDLYEHIINKLVNEDVPIFGFHADTIISIDEIYHLNTSGGILKSKFIFDSRTPPYLSLIHISEPTRQVR